MEDHLDEDSLRFADVDGTRTRYYADGDPGDPPLVLVHGGQFGSSDALGSWSLNLDRLAEHFRVYAFDRIGQGFTDPPPDAAYTFETVCDHAREFVRGLDAGPVHVVGHSRGGLVAAWLACEHPDLVRTTTLVDSSTAAPVPVEAGAQFYRKVAEKRPSGPPSLDTVRVEPAENSWGTEHVTDAFLDRRLEIARLDGTREASERMNAGGRATFFESVDAVRERFLVRIDADGMPVPSLVVWGADDPSAPIEWGLDLYQRVRTETDTAELHVVNRAGHYSFRERPRAFERTLAAFCLD